MPSAGYRLKVVRVQSESSSCILELMIKSPNTTFKPSRLSLEIPEAAQLLWEHSNSFRLQSTKRIPIVSPVCSPAPYTPYPFPLNFPHFSTLLLPDLRSLGLYSGLFVIGPPLPGNISPLFSWKFWCFYETFHVAYSTIPVSCSASVRNEVVFLS